MDIWIFGRVEEVYKLGVYICLYSIFFDVIVEVEKWMNFCGVLKFFL